jgi:hypothetical protein
VTPLKTIHRYRLPITDEHTISMRRGAEILSVARRDGTTDAVDMWALVGDTTDAELRTFRIFGTGHPVPDDANLAFVGTVQVHNGQLVFHVFEKVA